MHLASQQTLPVGQDDAWAALNDTEILKACIPGCESIVASGPNQYDVALTAAVGPVKAKFKGKLKLTDLKPPESYTIHFDGQGGGAGHGKGKADVRLEAKGPRETLLHYTATASVGGKIAQVGSRLVDMAAQQMAAQFFSTLDEQLRQRHGVVETAPAGETRRGPLARLIAWLRGLFGA
jgi:carbon monoxide dehydrogenase subunit G